MSRATVHEFFFSFLLLALFSFCDIVGTSKNKATLPKGIHSLVHLVPHGTHAKKTWTLAGAPGVMGGMVGYRWNFPSMLRSIEPPWLHGKTTGTIYHAKKRQKRLDSERFQEVRLRTLARNVRMGQEYWYGYFRYSSQSCCS